MSDPLASAAREHGREAPTAGPAARSSPVAAALAARRVLVVVPAYNEADSLPTLIEELRTHAPQCDFVVVDDGSRDDTRKVAERLGALVVALPFNLGIGGAVQCGLRYAWRQGYDVCVQCDGDGQHDPAEVGPLVAALVAEEADLAIGSRFLTAGGFRSSALRRLGISVLSRWIRLFGGQRIADPTSGFRAVSRPLMGEFARSYPQEYPEPESVFAALHRGYKVIEVPVRMRPRTTGRSSIRAFDSLLYMVQLCVAIAVDALRAGRSGRRD